MDYKNLIFDKVSKFGGEDIFIEEARKIWLRDPENVSKIYILKIKGPPIIK